MKEWIRRSALVFAPVLALGLTACEADVEEEAELPDVEVEEGQVPEVDVEGPDVEVGQDTVVVPDVNVEVPEDTL